MHPFKLRSYPQRDDSYHHGASHFRQMFNNCMIHYVRYATLEKIFSDYFL